MHRAAYPRADNPGMDADLFSPADIATILSLRQRRLSGDELMAALVASGLMEEDSGATEAEHPATLTACL